MQLHTGSGRFDLAIPAGHAVSRIPAWYHRPANITGDSPVVIVLHGTSRAAQASRDKWASHADEHGFFIVAPDFGVEYFSDPCYAYANLWSAEDPFEPQDWSASYGFILDRLFDVVNLALGRAAQQFILYGHSAGAAFAHRYLTFSPEDRVSQAIFANAGWYTLFDRDRPLPFGLKGSGISEAQIRRALQKPVTILIGDRDRHGPYPPWWSDEHLAQGPHRFARSQTYFQSAQRMAAELGLKTAWRWQVVPDVAHQNARMIAPAVQVMTLPQPPAGHNLPVSGMGSEGIADNLS
ncbi:MAG: hypothetical protein RIC36_16725 [Rhodospirillales bacterium]